MDTDTWEKEFRLTRDQDHFEVVWTNILKHLSQYVSKYLDEIAQKNPSMKPENNLSVYISQLLENHDNTHVKYAGIFEPGLMDEYADDVDGFKGTILSKNCLVIQKTLNSKSDALNDWKKSYRIAPPQKLFDTFYNMISYAEDYNAAMSEEKIKCIDSIAGNELLNLEVDACYYTGVVGTGILSTVLNSIYPRLFPGQFRSGVFSLYFISGKKPIEMDSDTSEFIMVKDERHSKTGIIESEHNYFFPYDTFSLYTLKIYRILSEEIVRRYKIHFPIAYRYILTNDFYQQICNFHKEDIKTLVGNDDVFKFGYSI